MPEKKYRKITGKKAKVIWEAIYRNRCWTDRGCRWGWAEIYNGVRNVFITSNDGNLLTSDDIEITIGL